MDQSEKQGTISHQVNAGERDLASQLFTISADAGLVSNAAYLEYVQRSFLYGVNAVFTDIELRHFPTRNVITRCNMQ